MGLGTLVGYVELGEAASRGRSEWTGGQEKDVSAAGESA